MVPAMLVIINNSAFSFVTGPYLSGNRLRRAIVHANCTWILSKKSKTKTTATERAKLATIADIAPTGGMWTPTNFSR